MSEPEAVRVLDTTTLSSLMRGDSSTIDRFEAFARSGVVLPQPVVAEVRFGLERLPRSRKRAHLEARLEAILREVPRVSWTDEVSACFGRIKADLKRAGRALEDFDIAIAAHAAAYGGVLVTSNVRHMSRIRRLSVEDWTR